MARTQIILFDRPVKSNLNNDPLIADTNYLSRQRPDGGGKTIDEPWFPLDPAINPTYDPDSVNPNAPNIDIEAIPNSIDDFGYSGQPNTVVTPNTFTTRDNSNGMALDGIEDVEIPLTYNIVDIRQPEKRKTDWSKSVRIPGTANNNRIFNHLYEISGDSLFNPNKKRDVIILNDGIQVMKGIMQVKNIIRSATGKIDYDVVFYGVLTGLFSDLGEAKLSDLPLSEWDHIWSETNVRQSWDGNITKNSLPINNITYSGLKTLSKIEPESGTDRSKFTTTTAHGYVVGDWVRILWGNTTALSDTYQTAAGSWEVTAVGSATTFTINNPLPLSFYPILVNGVYDIPSNTAVVVKSESLGVGYVYPMISWGDEAAQDSFPVTSFAPSYYAKELLDKIFKLTGSSYNSTFLNSEMFRRLIVTQKKAQYDVSTTEVHSRAFRVGKFATFSTNVTSVFNYEAWANMDEGNPTDKASVGGLGSLQPTILPYDIESGAGISSTGSYIGFFDGGMSPGTTGSAPSTGNWQGNRWKVTKPSQYDFTASINMSSWIDMMNYSGCSSCGQTFSWLGSGDPTRAYTYAYAAGSKDGVSGGPSGLGGERLEVYLNVVRKRNGSTSTIASSMDTFQINRNAIAQIKVDPNDSTKNNTSWWTQTQPTTQNDFLRYQPNPSGYNNVKSPLSWVNRKLNVNVSTFFAKDDEVWVEVKYKMIAAHVVASTSGFSQLNTATLFREYNWNGGSPIQKDINGKWQLQIHGLSYCFNTPSPKSGEGSIIYAKEFLPNDMLCKDFLTSIFKSFNLHIEADNQIDKLYNIEPRDDYYKDGSGGPSDFNDWTNKVDINSEQSKPLGELTAKFYKFENKAENDYWNKRFKDERGREYQQYIKEIDNDFQTTTFNITTEFGSTVMINNPAGSDVVMPAILEKDGTTFKPSSNTLPRLLLWVGPRPYTKDNGSQLGHWNFLSQTYTGVIASTVSSGVNFYPYAGTVDSPRDPMWDLNWFNQQKGDFVYWDYARWTNHNLYNAYWKSYIEEISDKDSKVITYMVALTPADIYQLDFKKIHIINGNWLRLQKVMDFNGNGKSLTKCEFLKLKSPTKFVKKSIFGGNGQIFEQIIKSSNISGIRTTVDYGPPRTKSVRTTDYGNVIPVATSNGSTIIVNGQANQVGHGISVHITGDENQVGSNVENIHISGGNGNFILGGVKNVSLIGTSNIVVEESDVTYINGIRYKDGVAISRASFIDAGQDIVINSSSSNTVVNYIDAIEDAADNNGSSSHENLIDAGQDKILPNLSQLGLSTDLTPNPRTNLSGGFAAQTGTASLVDIVRDNQRNIQSRNIQ